MEIHNLECHVQTGYQISSILDLNSELPLDGIMNMSAGGNISISSFVVPVGFEGDWDALPTIRVNASQSLSDTFDKPLGDHSGFLLGLLREGFKVITKCWRGKERF